MAEDRLTSKDVIVRSCGQMVRGHVPGPGWKLVPHATDMIEEYGEYGIYPDEEISDA